MLICNPYFCLPIQREKTDDLCILDKIIPKDLNVSDSTRSFIKKKVIYLIIMKIQDKLLVFSIVMFVGGGMTGLHVSTVYYGKLV